VIAQQRRLALLPEPIQRVLDRCPDHVTVGQILRCGRCSAVFWARMDRRRELDAQETRR
jgi:hypothetical protein